MQKLLFLALCGVIALFQYELWFGRGGVYDNHNLTLGINQRIEYNQKLQDRNDAVIEHLLELKGSPELMEARSRRDLNLVKPNETLVMLDDANIGESSVK